MIEQAPQCAQKKNKTPPSMQSVLNITAHVDHRFGGLTTSLPLFCEALESTERYYSPLGAFCLPDEESPSVVKGSRPPLVFPAGRFRWMYDRQLRNRLFKEIENASAIHIHGLWQEHGKVASEMARELGKPYIVSAHGMLEPWARRNKRWKKEVYWRLAERRRLEGAHCLRALTSAEAEHYRSAGLRQPVAIIPNGVDVPQYICTGSLFALHPELRDRRLLLFLGRLHPKKGVHLLCQSWAKICDDYRDTLLVFAGPDSEDTRASIETQVSQLGLTSRVTFVGMLRGDVKWAALRAATAFVLPSYSEGFSVAVLEAMGAGTPVIVSKQCYFPEINSSHCGWIIDPQSDALCRSLRECLELSSADRDSIGSRGRALVESRYQWSVVGQQTADLLDWTLGGQQPESLEIVD